jgi:hypothetical protein
MSGPKTITVVGGNLFRLAAEQLGDATQWNRIAAVNGLVDPFLQGLTTLIIPVQNANAGNGGILVGF